MTSLLLAAVLGSIGGPSESIKIGTHYTNGLAGLAVYRSAKESVLLDFGWIGPDGREHRGYHALVDADLHFGEAAPDDSYHRIWWNVGKARVTFEWGLIGRNGAVLRVRSSADVRLIPRLTSAWAGHKPELTATDSGSFSVRAGSLILSLNTPWPHLIDPTLKSLPDECPVNPRTALQFSMGAGNIPKANRAGAILDAALAKYRSGRLWAEGDWGDFLAPIEDQLGNSKIYSADTGRLAHVVSRGWCLPDGQVLFCWDSFFNGLLSSLEDPVAGKNTVRAILGEVTPDGFVPNYGGRGWGRSDDRSQPPVGSYCAWKMYLREPDIAFLKDVYPKLLRWHRWWLDKKGPGGRVNRDGNGDGLLEWGSTTGVLQNAKYESGLDDSPMFDDGQMDGPNMTSDATDLSALWAMDAVYLAKIAEKIGEHTQAAQLREQASDMAHRMDRLMWNDAVGAYCYRYWSPRRQVESYPLPAVLTSAGAPGLTGDYFEGQDLQGAPKTRHDGDVNFDWQQGPIDGIGHNNFSARWTGEFTAPKKGPYVFSVTSDDGCRLWLDDDKVLDGWSVHGATTYDSHPVSMEPGEKHRLRLEYFQAEGGASVKLSVARIMTETPGAVFSSRLSPLNFYPLMVDAPSKARARRTLDLFFRHDEFGGQYVCPTISRSDPAYPAQGYWRGTTWGPTSYLTFQGLRRYATDAEMTDYAGKSVALFMKNWNHDGTCHENFNSITGWGRSDPHYTWGALLCLVGLEQLCDTTEEGKITLNGASGRHIKVHNLRIFGKLYDLTVEPHSAALTRGGKIVAAARGRLASVALPE